MERQIVIRHKTHDLTATIHYPTSGGCEGRLPLTVICHGFVGSRIGVDRLFVVTARELAAEGQLVVRFDYAGCGESGGVYGEEGMESMILQTRTVLDYAMTCADIDPSRVTLIGHSLGGAVALLTAVRDRRVKSLAMWSSVGYPFNDIVKITGRERYDESVRTGSTDYLGYSFTPVFFESLGSFQPFQEASKFYGDVLVVHGTSDDVIPVDYAFLYQKLFWTREDSRCDKEIIFQADHTYSSGPHRRQLLDITKRWLQDRHKSEVDWQHWTI
ncbi:alpha/beta hydrolase [Saccharibacillus kuerlensis]|uniref:alpha/beta hydrolase n=2 Tax=Saccharibacillus kuerlensis TaxID=459527 RepID=UPI00037A3091|nr:alpha/beta hydrolase [Saccharibacillus kuerlensis]